MGGKGGSLFGEATGTRAETKGTVKEKAQLFEAVEFEVVEFEAVE
jgi:hypothetical protein